jgi:hypothetical protein
MYFALYEHEKHVAILNLDSKPFPVTLINLAVKLLKHRWLQLI